MNNNEEPLKAGITIPENVLSAPVILPVPILEPYLGYDNDVLDY